MCAREENSRTTCGVAGGWSPVMVWLANHSERKAPALPVYRLTPSSAVKDVLQLWPSAAGSLKRP